MPSTAIAEPPKPEARPKATSRRNRKQAVSCEDCFFQQRGLCALDLGEPCATFRLAGPNGPLPPRQPSLLIRSGGGELAA